MMFTGKVKSKVIGVRAGEICLSPGKSGSVIAKTQWGNGKIGKKTAKTAQKRAKRVPGH
jgi:hypothetical protein